MAEDKTIESGASGQGDLTVVPIPADKARAVLEFVAGLESDDAEVSGHMISGGFAGSLGGAMYTRAVKHRTDTGCVQSQTGVGVDFKCSDSDTVSS